MINRLLGQKALLGLALILIICLCSSFANADDKIPTPDVHVVDYAIVSGSQAKDLELEGEDISISGSIHTNAGLKIKAGSFKIDGICESVKGHDIISSVYGVDTSKFVDNGVVIDISELNYKLLITAIDERKMIVHVYPHNYNYIISDKNIEVQYDSVSGFIVGGRQALTVKNDMVYIFHDNVTFISGIKFIEDGIILGTGNIRVQGPEFDTTNGFAYVYSPDGNLLIDSNTSKFNGAFYAPKGNVKFIGENLDITGEIVADTITLNSNSIKITTKNKPIDEVIDEIISPTPTFVNLADINSDKAINMADVIILARVFNSIKGDGIYVKSCDLNGDGSINMGDVIIIAEFFNKVL